MASVTFPAFMDEFRNLKMECLIKDLHKMTPQELEKIREEIDAILNPSKEKGVYGEQSGTLLDRSL